MIELPIAWILGTIGTLSGVIATLATIMWGFMKSRLEAQDKIINSQGQIIEQLQKDIDRMSHGCGVDQCLWKHK